MPFMAILLLGVATFALPPPAHASFIMRFAEAGFTTMDVVDNGPGDLNPAVGNIIFSGTYGTYSIAAITGTSNRTTGGPIAMLQITTLAAQTVGPSSPPLTVTLGDTGFAFPSTPGSTGSLGSGIGATFTNAHAGDMFKFQSFADTSDTQFGTATPTPAFAFTATGGQLPESFSGFNSVDFVRSASYSLTDVSEFDLSAGAELVSSGSSSDIAAIPAPTGMVLALSGVLPLLGGLGWWRLRKKQA
jgi:hypothetical protein